MAQTKRRRSTKHRGNAAGMIESRGRTGRKPTAAEKSTNVRDRVQAKSQKLAKHERPPTWSGAFYRAMAAAVFMLLIMLVLTKKPTTAIAFFPIVLLMYVPLSYYTDAWLYKRRMRGRQAGAGGRTQR